MTLQSGAQWNSNTNHWKIKQNPNSDLTSEPSELYTNELLFSEHSHRFRPDPRVFRSDVSAHWQENTSESSEPEGVNGMDQAVLAAFRRLGLLKLIRRADGQVHAPGEVCGHEASVNGSALKRLPAAPACARSSAGTPRTYRSTWTQTLPAVSLSSSFY